MWKILAPIILVGSDVFAQDLSMGEVISVDACERHRLQIAEMTRGKGANSNDVYQFASFIEISAYISAYNTYAGHFETLNEALTMVLERCSNEPTLSIGQILYNHHRLELLIDEAERRRANAIAAQEQVDPSE